MTPLNGRASLRRIHSPPLMAAMRTEKSGQFRRSACRQCRTAHKDPRRPQLRRRGGHQRQWRGFRRGQFIQAHHRLNKVGEFYHLHFRHDDICGQLAASDGVARAGFRLRRSILILTRVGTAAALIIDHLLWTQTTCRRRHHEGQ